MSNSVKPIRLSAHAKMRASARGTCEEEIVEAIRTSEWKTSQLSKLECKKDFVFNKSWNNKFYRTKQVRPIFVEEDKEIIVITVYVYYF